MYFAADNLHQYYISFTGTLYGHQLSTRTTRTHLECAKECHQHPECDTFKTEPWESDTSLYLCTLIKKSANISDPPYTDGFTQA